MNRAYLSLGSNINPEANLQQAITLLSQKAILLAISSIWETTPIGITDQPNFLNMAALVATDFSPKQFKAMVLDEIETALNRDRSGHRFGPRTIDIDLMLFNDDIFEMNGHTIPNAEVLDRPFVAIPLAEISPDYRHPKTGQTLATIADGFVKIENEMWLRRDIVFDILPVPAPKE